MVILFDTHSHVKAPVSFGAGIEHSYDRYPSITHPQSGRALLAAIIEAERMHEHCFLREVQHWGYRNQLDARIATWPRHAVADGMRELRRLIDVLVGRVQPKEIPCQTANCVDARRLSGSPSVPTVAPGDARIVPASSADQSPIVAPIAEPEPPSSGPAQSTEDPTLHTVCLEDEAGRKRLKAQETGK